MIVLLLSYIRSFILDPNIFSFLGIQKWVFLYHKSQLILPFSIWPLLLLNKWYVWFGDRPVISDPQWRITWPLLTLFTLVTVAYYFLKKRDNKPVEVIMIWSILYILFFSFGQITSRYLVILFPIFYIVNIYGCSLFLNDNKKVATNLKKYIKNEVVK